MVGTGPWSTVSGRATSDRHLHVRARGAARAPPRARRGPRAHRLRALRRAVHPVLHELRLPRDRAAGRGRRERRGRAGRVRPRVRGRARARGDRRSSGSSRTRSTRASSIRCASSGGVLADMGITGAIGADSDGYPGILGYQGPALERGHGRPRRAARAVDREHDGAQERGRGGADPGERPLVRARPPAAAGVHAAGRDRGGGEPAGRPRGDARDARGARPVVRRPAGVVRRRLGRLPRPDRPAQRVGARGRPQHRVPRRATCS